MSFINFAETYLPDSENITKSVKCIVNVEHISMVLPLVGDISGANAVITVAGRDIHVVETIDVLAKLIESAGLSMPEGASFSVRELSEKA